MSNVIQSTSNISSNEATTTPKEPSQALTKTMEVFSEPNITDTPAISNIANSYSQKITALPPEAAPQIFKTQNNDIQALENNLSVENIAVGTTVNINNFSEQFKKEDGLYGTSNPYGFIQDGKAGLFIVGKVDSSKPLTIYVHGINGTPLDMATLVEANKDTNVAVFSYPTGLSIHKSGELLSDSINTYTQNNEISNVNIVAHSLGGRVTMSALQNNEKQGVDNVNNVVTIASPMGGDWRAAGSQVADELFGGPFIPPSWVDLSPDSENYNNLKGLNLGNINYTAVYTMDKDTKVAGYSQRDSVIKKQADMIVEIDQSHIGVLSDKDTIDVVSSAISTPITTKEDNRLSYNKPDFNDHTFQSIHVSSSSQGENTFSYSTSRDYSLFYGGNSIQFAKKQNDYEVIANTQLGLGDGANQIDEQGYYRLGSVSVSAGYNSDTNNPFIQTAVNGEIGHRAQDYKINTDIGIAVRTDTDKGIDTHLGASAQLDITPYLSINARAEVEYSNDKTSFNNTVGLEYRY